MEGNGFCALLHDGPMLFAICGATLYCHANMAQLWSSLSKTRGVASLRRYGVHLSRAKAHQVVTDLRVPPPLGCPPITTVPMLDPPPISFSMSFDTNFSVLLLGIKRIETLYNAAMRTTVSSGSRYSLPLLRHRTFSSAKRALSPCCCEASLKYLRECSK